MTRFLVIAAVLAAAPAVAHADDFDPQQPAPSIHGGGSELDVGALGVLTHQSTGDNNSTTQVSTLLSFGYQYYLSNALSVGGEALVAYDRQSSAESTTAYGGAVFGSAHARLGHGAYFRPTLVLGALFGSSSVDTGVNGLTISDNSKAFLMRFQLPFAYFATDNLVLQAGPELDVQLGSVSASGSSDSTGSTTIVGGFSVAVGYAF